MGGLDSEVSPRTKTPIKKVQLQFVHPGQRIKVGPFSQPQARRTSRGEYRTWWRASLLLQVMSSTGAGAGAGGAGQQKQKRNNLDSDHRDVVIAELLRGSSAGKLQKGDIQRVAVKFDSNRWTIARLRGLFFSSPVYDTDMNVRLLWRYCCGGTAVVAVM